jgi:xylose dehydrogenase (NAD/NADP)
MSVTSLNWGILGTANISKALHKPLRISKRNQLLAIASRSRQKADDYARQYKIKRAYGSYEELLADPDIHVVYIPLPNHLHAEWTIKAVQAGKHVLCEKPLALSLEEVDAISAAAKQHDKVVAEAFMYRTHPLTLKIEEMISAGKLGRIQLIRGSFTFKSDDPDNIRWDPEMGGGALWDVGCYPLNYARAMVGTEPTAIFASQVVSPKGVDGSIFAQLEFPGEVYAQIDGSFMIPYHTFMELIGDQATLIIPKPFTPGLNEKVYINENGKTSAISIKGSELYLDEVEDMADAILLGKANKVSLEDSRANTAAILAILQSAKTGLKVTL